MMSRRKRDGKIKSSQQPKEDRFSKLTEPLIIEIISLLDLKDAVKTSVLAKSWKNIWTQVNNVVLRRNFRTGYRELSIEQREHKEWMSSAYSTFTKCTTKHINRFAFLGYSNQPYSMDNWISFVLDRKVKILELAHCDVPERLFQNPSVTKMELCFVDFTLSTPVNMSSLKSLLLNYPRGCDAYLEMILTCCPVLENLVLEEIFNIYNNINIMSPSVKTLKLHDLSNERGDNAVLNIKTPWLQELEISGLFCTTPQLIDVSSLTKATLTFHTNFLIECDTESDEESDEDNNDRAFNNMSIHYNDSWIPMVTKLLKSLAYVGELVIGSDPIQVLTLSKLSGKHSPLFKCKHLSIETPLWKFDLPGIACLLERAPYLETLVIKVVFDLKEVTPLFQTEILFQDEDTQVDMPNGKFFRLKNVTIEYCETFDDNVKNRHGGFYDFKLVEYILKSVVVLKKLVLCSSSGSRVPSPPVPNCAYKYVRRLSSKLTDTLLNEEEAEWELKKNKNKAVFTFPVHASAVL